MNYLLPISGAAMLYSTWRCNRVAVRTREICALSEMGSTPAYVGCISTIAFMVFSGRQIYLNYWPLQKAKAACCVVFSSVFSVWCIRLISEYLDLKDHLFRMCTLTKAKNRTNGWILEAKDGLMLEVSGEKGKTIKKLPIRKLKVCCRDPALTIPEEVWNLELLEELNLVESNIETLPKGIEKLKTLKVLNLSDCKNLAQLPEMIGSLVLLEELFLSGCRKIEALPNQINNLKMLKVLSLSDSNLIALPNEVGCLLSLETVYLRKTKLTALPEAIGNLKSLKKLSLSDNEHLAQLPERIGELEALEKLDLSSCSSLTSLPNKILELPESCEVCLEGCSLSERVIRDLQQRTSARDYRGPRLFFSMATYNRSVKMISLEKLLEEINECSGKKTCSFNLEILTNTNKNSLRDWLSRLKDTADYQRGNRKQFASCIASYLEKAQTDKDFCETFFNTIEEATSSCGDRVALSILHIDINYQLTVAKDPIKVRDLLIHGVWTLSFLEECAREKVKTLHFVDEIEVYLAYPIQLKESLNIPIHLEQMLFFGVSGVTPEDLKTAEEYVQARIESLDAQIDFLIAQPKWCEVLSRTNNKDYEAFPDPTADFNAYKAGLKELTKGLLDFKK